MNRPLAWLASFRLRILLRTSFLFLAVVVLMMTVTVLQEEKQRSNDNYRSGLLKTKEQIVARLLHPAGQLALLNPRWDAASAAEGRPLLLPFSAIDFDDQNKARNAIEMANCLTQFPDHGSLCIAIGNNPWAGGYLYIAGTFASGPLSAHRIGDEFLDGAHRLRVEVSLGELRWHWIAPFETLVGNATGAGEGIRGRFTGYRELTGRDYTGARPLREFRGWIWQNGQCLEKAAVDSENCRKKSFFSLRLPVETLRTAILGSRQPVWPPRDLDQYKVRIELLPPGDGAAIFSNAHPGSQPSFALDALAGLLAAGETLSIQRIDNGQETPVAQLLGRADDEAPSSPLLARLIRHLPVDSLDTPLVELTDEIATPLGNYRLQLNGDARSVNQRLAAVATRLSWFIGAMLGAIAVAWLVIETGLIRRIARLTRRTRGLSQSVHTDGGLERYELADLRGRDELGLLAGGLDELLHRVREDADREHIRAAQEKDMWHAVGHEIVSPLQSLLALHGNADDPSHRYISRMQQAIRVLYGSASPSEAFAGSQLDSAAVDLAIFLKTVAEHAGIADVRCVGIDAPLFVRADEFALEDVFSHLLRNAERYRPADTPITLSLSADERLAHVAVANRGPRIADDRLEQIFEYGVSDQPESAAEGNRGQGLFVARTYMAKMSGTIVARNTDDGVVFLLTLPRAESPSAR
ncbi:sensor histidine kinase KdpD [Azonexus sp. R2A61]|uniref:sensor histidine kinase n=1 Tax=Azonexus sp. R2A61 TaxID=2744443 RepID=UPI001F2C85B0|nr:HAMP domain-containing sensor histidine kinase [Azonexus sp. R2A61]